MRGSWAECHFFFLWFTNCVLLFDKSIILGCLWPLVFVLNNTLILGIWCSTIPHLPGCFLSLDLLWEYRIQHGANGPLYVTSSYSTWIFCRGVSGFATDCPCGVWCRGLTTCLLYDGPLLSLMFLKWPLACTFVVMKRNFQSIFAFVYVFVYYARFTYYFSSLYSCLLWHNFLYKILCSTIFHRRSLGYFLF